MLKKLKVQKNSKLKHFYEWSRCSYRPVSSNLDATQARRQGWLTHKLHGDEAGRSASGAERGVQMTPSRHVAIGWLNGWLRAQRTCRPVVIRPAMLLRKKVCAAVLIAGILFLMLASQSIQRRHFLPLSITLPVNRVVPTGRETGGYKKNWTNQKIAKLIRNLSNFTLNTYKFACYTKNNKSRSSRSRVEFVYQLF